jgi:hypothetical protein
MTRRVRWTLAVAVLAVAGAVAVWPRVQHSTANSTQSVSSAAEQDNAALAPLRRWSALRPD